MKTITKQHFSLYNVAPTVYKTQVLILKQKSTALATVHDTSFKNFSYATCGLWNKNMWN